MTWRVIYESTDQTIEQRVIGEGDAAVIEERVTWHRDTPERLVENLTAQVADLEAQATGKITKAALTAKVAARDIEAKAK